MPIDMILGCLVIAAAVITLIGLSLWSRTTINRTAARGFGTAREIINDRSEK